MDHSLTKVTSNWTHIGGCEFSECFQELAADADVFIKPDITKLVDEEKSFLLSRQESSDFCELYVKKFPYLKIQAVSFACNAVKVEIFQGHIKEYMETVYGSEVDETDDEFKTYRYDVEIEKSGVTELTLRVCIFGLMLHTSPNPNGITSLLPFNRCLNAQNVSDFEAKPETVSKKCEELLKLITDARQDNSLPLDQQSEQKLNISNDKCGGTNKKTNEDVVDKLKLHIDERLKEFEMRIYKNLADIEHRQNQKLDKLLRLLENK